MCIVNSLVRTSQRADESILSHRALGSNLLPAAAWGPVQRRFSTVCGAGRRSRDKNIVENFSRVFHFNRRPPE